MSEVRLNLIDAREAIQGTIHSSVADAVIASLSAEPETIAELEAALDRFCKRNEDHSPFAWFVAGEDTDPWDAGVVIVDLAARIVAADSSYSALHTQGEVNYHNGNEATEVWLPYRLPDDWLFLTSALEYKSMRSDRRAARMADPRLNVRQVLYGRPMIEFIVSACLAESERLDGSAIDEGLPEPGGNLELDCAEELDGFARNDVLVRLLHARWLMTPRIDLGGRTPREVILEKRGFIDYELNSREMQWSLLREGPPPLSRDSAAYRFAGFGTHEYVVYYYLVRHLLVRCWERVNRERDVGGELAIQPGADASDIEPGSVIPGDSGGRTERVEILEWLEQIKQAWLNGPSKEFDGRIPAAIIESERRRIPLVMTAKDIFFDENCDLCRMLAYETDDDFGPAFWHLDGCNMDPGFEFSTYQTREEWEAEKRRWQESYDEFERQWAAEHPASGNDSDDVDTWLDINP